MRARQKKRKWICQLGDRFVSEIWNWRCNLFLMASTLLVWNSDSRNSERNNVTAFPLRVPRRHPHFATLWSTFPFFHFFSFSLSSSLSSSVCVVSGYSMRFAIPRIILPLLRKRSEKCSGQLQVLFNCFELLLAAVLFTCVLLFLSLGIVVIEMIDTLYLPH